MTGNNRPRTSRTSTGRPRKIAGQAATVTDAAVEEAAEAAGVSTSSTTDEVPTSSTTGSRRITIALLATIVVLLGVGAWEVWYLARDDTPAPSAARPVVVGDATRGEAVETAARSTEEAFSTGYQDYDAQVDQAMSRMTDAFATTYRQTAEGIRDRVIATKTRLQAKVVGQSVVQASPEQVQALLFLNQYVQKVVDGKPQTDFSQYRLLVTVVHTEHGWLVSDIATK